MTDRDHVFQKLCHEAVLACGADIAAIERYVLDRIQILDEESRERAKREVERVLSYQPPSRKPGLPH